MWTAPFALFVLSGLGVNIHTTAPAPGEAAFIRSSGFQTVRMDLHWHDTETRPGHYDWTPYDRLVAALRQHAIRPLLILNYGHPAYDGGLAPSSPAARAAFARWAAAAVTRYKGQGILWEIYNEPNLAHFWKPSPDPSAYVALASETAAAIRAAAPGETIIGPASSGVDLEFLEACFRLGLLDSLDAVTVHPYRHHEPESVLADYRRLRALIARYAKGREIPVLCGEWGYSAAWSDYGELKQALMLTRLFLVNTEAGIPLTVLYDWRNDGPSSSEPEHNFGILAHDGSPKAAWRAISTLASELEGYQFHLRLQTGRADEFVLLFKSNAGPKIIAWTTSPRERRVLLPVSSGPFRLLGWLGGEERTESAGPQGLLLTLTGQPQYVAPLGLNENLLTAARWDSLPHTLRVIAPAQIELATNYASRSLSVLRNDGGRELSLELPLAGGGAWRQHLWLEVGNPVELTLTPAAVLVGNPAPQPLDARLLAGDFETPVSIPANQEASLLKLPAPIQSASANLTAPNGELLAALPEIRFSPAGSIESSVLLYDGDSKVPAEAALDSGCQEDAPGLPCAGLNLRIGAGARFLRLAANPGKLAIPDNAVALGVWVRGDASGVFLRLRFTDSAGQVFQPAGVCVNWRGWRWVEIPIAGDDARAAFWGGAADGVPRGPLTLDTLLLLDKPGPGPLTSHIAVSTLFWIRRAA